MDSAKRDEHMSEHAANLLGTGQRYTRTHNTAKVQSRYLKILCAVLLLGLLALILTIIFLLKLRCSDKVIDSCKNRCISKSHDGNAGCRCDAACVNEGTCCLDYEEVCLQPTQLWTCSKFRCGEDRLPSSLCSCSADCVKVGDCCANYKRTCEGEKSWLQEDCEDIRTPQCPAGFSKSPLLLVSLDGFRAGYMNAYSALLPAIRKLRECGTSTPYMRPAYPTKTFPNHYTIVTGLYPETHGIVDNKMYDVNRNASFSLKVDEKFNPLWYQGEPVWITAMKNHLKTATFFWPGSDVKVHGRYPDYWIKYNRNILFEKRIAQIFQWLHLPEGERPDFYTLYFEEPDASGHKYGPMSTQVIEALINVDRLIGMLMDGLKERNLHKCVNVVLVSDHGMEEASCKKAAYVSNYLDNINDITVIQGPAARVRPRHVPEEFFSFDYEGLVKNLSCREPNQPMKPYLKEHLPKRLHFAKNIRIERAHLYMQPQWQAALKPSEIKYCRGGFHGSDNVFKNMQAIFIGYGPGIHYNTTVPPFENIEVYNLLCDLLGISPAANNGTHGSLNHILKKPRYQPVFPAERSAPSTCSAVSSSLRDPRGCTCDSLTEAEVNRLNQRLINSNSDSNVKPVHLPFGIPRVLQDQSDYCILHHSSYISGYSRDILMPLWVSYSLNTTVVLHPSAEWCVRADVRVQASDRQSCSIYKNNSSMSFGLLHPPNFSPAGTEPDSLITSNMVPMYPGFKDIWTHFHNFLLIKFSEEMNGINVVSGPIFDNDFDGNYDFMNKGVLNGAPIPTHFFIILTSCKNSSLSVRQCEGPLDAVSFILPHRPDHLETCHNGTDYSWFQDWVQLHVARIRDIELLTGLSFYHDRISVAETLQLKTRLKTF
ncbi:ectonucleotide pyrophosphatase/phosphodiesterase family member 1 isoform X1 [Danio rerio]|uniref:Ectonucleotide pyrophosphatase/phosphodiesterase 1 n=1 Tax=Danio rerio TaxID=7955 RepID=B0JZL7_DANRE|nr:ectonucleotide pyrophosphatase/phosphodiesterase family member 1 isoform X1 [Danio rerio]AAI59234.1 Si:ch211-142e24.2 protein [Danio rerio]|eukprot:XP_005160498.1 ectonucleotide pyrophosphatase/phosphodiesterase family member 1 isoform X1 [Danio rerio]